VRELRNVLERAAILCRTAKVGVEHLPSGFVVSNPPPMIGDLISMDKLEESHIRRILAATPSLERAAEVLGMDVATLYRKRRRYNI
jgi:NtrC-family two-component system response regulator AlgB